MDSTRRRRKPTKSTAAAMLLVETEIAKLVASDPAVEQARLRAVRRAARRRPAAVLDATL